MLRKLTAISTAAVLAAGPALADVNATATTDLNLRAGPGPNYKIVDVIAANDAAVVGGCLENSKWCEVEYNGQTGWAYSEYLTTPVEGEEIVLYDNYDRVKVRTVTYDSNSQAAAAASLGTVGGVLGSAIVGGPAAIAVGALIGSVAGAAMVPDEQTVTYVESNPVDPVFVNGEVVVGATIPGEVVLYPTNDEDFVYANLNGQYVVVKADERQIVRIIR